MQGSALPDTSPIKRLIRSTRYLLRSTWVITGLGLTVGLLLGTLVAATLVDLAAPLWQWLRLAALLVIVIPASWVVLTRVVRPLFRRLTAVAVAKRIESHIPGIHNRLVSSLDLSSGKQKQPVSQAFYRRLLTEALDRIRAFKPSRVVDFFRLRRAGLYALTSMTAFLLALFLFTDRLPTAVARILNPFADIPPASGVIYTVSTNHKDNMVLRGEDIVFTAKVEKGEPERLTLELKSASAEKLRHDLQKQGDLWRFTLSGKLPTGFEDKFTYRVYGGGTWSKRAQVTMVERPRITDLHTVLHYPQYMDLPSETHRTPAQTAEVAGPQGGEIEVVVKADGDVERGEVQILKTKIERAPVANRPERFWFENDLPAGANKGVVWTWNHGDYRGRKHTHLEPPGVGERSHWFHGATTGFRVPAEDNLFAYVYLPANNKPEAIMLQWNDGNSMEHGAYWGADKIKLGRAGTPSRFRAGDLPRAGEWVRLEVPARAVDLDGRALHGMSFTIFGGQCAWHGVGTIPAGHREIKVMVPAKSFAMKHLGKNVWSGRFPLEGEGFYRVELRDALNHPNKTMKESKYTSLPDNPPQIVLERPEGDLTLSKPGKVQLAMKAFDDYGLKEVAVLSKRENEDVWSRRVVKTYAKPRRDDNDVTATIDLAALKMVLGDTLRYKVEAVDRKGQAAESSEFMIRLATGPNTLETQLAEFEKTQDPFQEKLMQLIATQTKVREAMEKLAVKYSPLLEKINFARIEAQGKLDPVHAKLVDTLRSKLMELALEKIKAREMGLPETKPAPNQPVNLDPQSAQLVNEATQKLTELARQREQNAGVKPTPQGPQLDAESKKLLKEMTDKLAELSRQKAEIARSGKQPPPKTPAPKLDAESAKLLNNLQKKLSELEEEKEKRGSGAKPVQLDSPSAQELAAMQRELAELAKQQQTGLQQGEQLNQDLNRAAEQASKMPLLKGQIAEQMKAMQQTFEQQAVQAMKDLLAQMSKAAAARKEMPPEKEDLESILKRNERLKKELEAMKERMKALARARKNLMEDPEALKELMREMKRQEGGLTARELQELKEYLERLQAELKRQRGTQELLKSETTKASDRDLSEIADKQDQMDKDVGKMLDRARKLQDLAKLRRKRNMNLPRAPYTPEADEEKTASKEDDSDEPLPAKDKEKNGKNNSGKANADKTDKKKTDDDDDDDEKKFLPQLGGKKQKIDPRYARKRLPNPKKGQPLDPSDLRDDLDARQTDNLRDLDSAEKALDADAQSLQSMLQQMAQAMQKAGHEGKGQQSEADQAANQLAQMMQSPAMQQALAMAQRMRQQGQRGNQPTQRSPYSTTPNLNGNPLNGQGELADLSKLDLPTRSMILKMQPKLREELLQGMRNEGPEGYQKHIQEYYKRLLKIKGSK
jgi:hypothetical protein